MPITAAAIATAGAAIVLAPIDASAVRSALAVLDTPEPAPAPEPEPTPVINFDNDGSYWGAETIANTEALIARERAAGTAVDEWHVSARDGQPLRIIDRADPTFLDSICVIPGVRLADAVRDAAAAGAHPALGRLSPGCADPDVLAARDAAAAAHERAAALYRLAAATLAGRQH